MSNVRSVSESATRMRRRSASSHFSQRECQDPVASELATTPLTPGNGATHTKHVLDLDTK